MDTTTREDCSTRERALRIVAPHFVAAVVLRRNLVVRSVKVLPVSTIGWCDPSDLRASIFGHVDKEGIRLVRHGMIPHYRAAIRHKLLVDVVRVEK